MSPPNIIFKWSASERVHGQQEGLESVRTHEVSQTVQGSQGCAHENRRRLWYIMKNATNNSVSTFGILKLGWEINSIRETYKIIVSNYDYIKI